MASYVQLGCGYPTANQFLTGSSLQTLSTARSATSPLNTRRSVPPAISSPSIGNDSGAASGAQQSNSGMLTPDPASQASTSGTASIATGSSSCADSGSSPYVCAATASPCCAENGRCAMRDPASGQTVCASDYDPARLQLGEYARLSSAGVGLYGTPYPANEQNPYASIGADSAPFYTSLSNPYAFKENSTGTDVATWTSAGLQPAAGYYTYDPTFGAYGYGAATYDLASRRKNTTRESTSTLKVWLNEHQKNPYPTKGEKIMLAIITKMTLTQVSTWFANARRRLKKENKITWEPKSRTEDDDDGGGGGDEDNNNNNYSHNDGALVTTDKKREKDPGHNNETEKRHGYGASVVSADGSRSSGTAAGADVAAVLADAAASAAGTVAVASAASVGGTVGSHNTGTGTGTDVGVGTLDSAQPKAPFQLHDLQQQQAQYLQHFYYNSSSHHQHQQQQQQQYHQLQQQQTAISALSQHAANSMTLHHHQQHQQDLHTHHLD